MKNAKFPVKFLFTIVQSYLVQREKKNQTNLFLYPKIKVCPEKNVEKNVNNFFWVDVFFAPFRLFSLIDDRFFF